MRRYVAFLGSINVGGNRLTMADLRAAFESEGFRDVETVVASGNVLFSHPERPSRGLEEKLELLVRERFGMKCLVAVRSRQEVAAAITENPFAGSGEDKYVHTVFLDRAVDADQFAVFVADHRGRGPERLAFGERELFIDYVEGAGASRLTAKFIEGKLGCRGTARSVPSLARILEKLNEDT